MRHHPHVAPLTHLILPIVLLLAASGTLLAACQPLPTPPPPTAVPTATAVPAAASPTAVVEPAPQPSAVPTRRIRPTPTPAFIGEEDFSCWGSCKAALDAPTPVPVGKAQPAGHAGRTTCLSCHRELAQPALPASHQGRLDPACAPCHAPAGLPAVTPAP